jgi:hypothetical protein
MVVVLSVFLVIGFVWNTVLNFSAESSLRAAMEEYVKLANEGKLDEFYNRIIPEEDYYFDGNSDDYDKFVGVKDKAKYLSIKRYEKIEIAKLDVKEFYGLLKSGAINKIDVMNVRTFDRVGGLVRLHFEKGWGEEKGIRLIEKMREYNEYIAVFNKKMRGYNKKLAIYNNNVLEYNRKIKPIIKENKKQKIEALPESMEALPESMEYPDFEIIETDETHEEYITRIKEYNDKCKEMEKDFSRCNKTVKDYNKVIEKLKKKEEKLRMAIEYKTFIILRPVPPSLSLPDYENIFFITRVDYKGRNLWMPLYHSNSRIERNEQCDGNSEFNEIIRTPFLAQPGRRIISNKMKYPGIIRKMTKYSRQVGDSRQAANKESKIEGNLKNNLRIPMDCLNKPGMTRDKFLEWGTPSFLSKEEQEKKKEILGQFFDTFHKHYVQSPKVEPENPIEIKAAYPNLISRSLLVYKECGEDTKGDCVGGALKVVFEASRKRLYDLGKIGKQDWQERTWSAIYYVVMIRHVNPKTKEYRWLPVALTDKYDEEFLKNEIIKELANRKAISAIAGSPTSSEKE